MHRNSVIHSSNLLFIVAVIVCAIGHARAQNSLSVSQPPRSVSILDSTKEQDGLVGSVRRIRTEAAKVEVKDGREIEGPLRLRELTTYSIKGNRLENTSYPLDDVQVGKEEYKYDERGNITEMTARDDGGAIVSRESYSYEFDNVGNWTKMTTSLLVFENGRLKHEPIENTYRTITYYFTDDVAKLVDSPVTRISPSLPQTESLASNLEAFKPKVQFGALNEFVPASFDVLGNPPALLFRHVVSSAIKNSSNVEPVREVGSGSTATTEDSPQKVAFDYYQKGLEDFDKGNTQTAVSSFLISVKFAPSASVYLSLGNAYLKLEKNKDAAKAFKESVSLAPNLPDAHYGLGLASYRLKRFVEARDSFKNATAVAPKLAKAHYGLGLSLLELGMSDASIAEVKILEKLDKQLARQLAAATPQVNYTCRFSVCR